MSRPKKKTKKIHQEKKNQSSEEEQPKIEFKVYWPTIVLVGFITSIVFIVIDTIISLIIIFGFNKESLVVLGFMRYVIYGELGLVVMWGACLGNIGQSVAISKIKEKFLGSTPVDKYNIKHATLNTFTYYTAGGFLLFYALALEQILAIIVKL